MPVSNQSLTALGAAVAKVLTPGQLAVFVAALQTELRHCGSPFGPFGPERGAGSLVYLKADNPIRPATQKDTGGYLDDDGA